MELITVAQTLIKKMFDYPEEYAKGTKQLYISNGYISNGYVMITQSIVKNHSEIITTNDEINYFFDITKIVKIGKLPVKDSTTRMEDTTINARITPPGEELLTRKITIINTGMLLHIHGILLQVWIDTNTNEYVFFNNALLLRFKFTYDTLYGWTPDNIFMDTLDGNFMIGIMPIRCNIFKDSKFEGLNEEGSLLLNRIKGFTKVLECL